MADLAALARATLAEANSIKANAAHIATSYKELLKQSNFDASQVEAPKHSNADTVSSIRHAYISSLSALHDCSKCLDEIAIYWEYHDSQLRNIANTMTVPILGNIHEEVMVWAGEHDAVRQAISDITACCDALTVTPVEHSKLWKKAAAQVVGKAKLIRLPPAPVT